jgi:hypothetical protein
VERPFDRLTVLSNVKGHQVLAGYAATQQSHVTTATDILCACPPSVVRIGGDYRLGCPLGVKLKRDPMPPFESVAETHLFGLLPGHETRSVFDMCCILERTNEMIPSCQDGCLFGVMELICFLWRTDEINAWSPTPHTDGKRITSIG